MDGAIRALLRASIALLLGTLACGDDPLAPGCGGPIDVRVSGSFPPLITWAPDCSVEHLSAGGTTTSGFVLYWALTAGQRRIESGVQLGRTPRGVVEELPLAPIAAGATVVVALESPRGTVVGAAYWFAP